MSKIHIVCPNPTTIMKKAQNNIDKDNLYQNLWIVSRESYDHCNTDYAQGSRLLLRCVTPLMLKYYTLVFQRYSAVSSQVFIPGKEYYFIGMYSIERHLACLLRSLVRDDTQQFNPRYAKRWRHVLHSG